MVGKVLLLFVVILAVSALAEERDSWLTWHGLEKQWRQKDRPPVVYSKTGEQRKEVRGVRNEPKLVVDTVRFSGGSALITLNRYPSGRRESVSATSLTIYSADTGTAEVILMVQ
ncbi:MAG: hypothetical protein ACYTF1_25870 [Planctomycetota bacterium]|jgi:hypothetical protein